MKKTILEHYRDGDELAKEYLEYVKDSVKTGVFYKDSLDWYLFRYLSPLCDRTKLFVSTILAIIVVYALYDVIDNSFPLVKQQPIFVWEKDASKYFPHLKVLKPKEGDEGYDSNIKSVDEAILKYLLTLYVTERESFNFNEFRSIVDLNYELTRKRNYIEEQSSLDEYNNNYRKIISDSNPLSPINMFGTKVNKNVEIESVLLIKEEFGDFASQAKNFLNYNMPTKADIVFSLVNTDYSIEFKPVTTRQKFMAKIEFSFDGASIENSMNGDDNEPLNFKVTKYRLFKIK